MKNSIFLSAFLFLCISCQAQGPAITSWLQNTTQTGTYYVSGSATVLDNGIVYNCQKVEYSDDFVYVTTNGIPAYPTGPFNDGNPSQATSQGAIYKIPLSPVKNEGSLDETTGGNIGVFINGVSLFDSRDGVAWNANTNSLCGGPPGGNPPCPGGMAAQQDWNRDAIPAEMDGFDCSKAHPAMGNYHHHQNPSAFKLDLNVVSDICTIYDADGLYSIDENQHSPLIGFAYDGFPIYGAYGFANTDGTGEITRIKSSYQLREITQRDQGPDVGGDYFLGYFREDYEYIASDEQDRLDEHNGRICITPEYPNGTYAYFATVDENWNSLYPYVVGPTFYGTRENRKVTNIDEATTVYDGFTSVEEIHSNELHVQIFPNPAAELMAIQINNLSTGDLQVDLMDLSGKVVRSTQIKQGSTIAYFDTQTIYAGSYLVRIWNEKRSLVEKVIIAK